MANGGGYPTRPQDRRKMLESARAPGDLVITHGNALRHKSARLYLQNRIKTEVEALLTSFPRGHSISIKPFFTQSNRRKLNTAVLPRTVLYSPSSRYRHLLSHRFQLQRTFSLRPRPRRYVILDTTPALPAAMDENPEQTDDHPLSEKQTNTDNKKLSVAVAAVTDPKFPLPQLGENSSTLEYVLSFATLFLLLGGGIYGAWLYGVTLLQTSQPLLLLPAVFVVTCGVLGLAGTFGINWWELVLGYWWLSMPVGALAGLVLVLNQEASTGLEESS